MKRVVVAALAAGLAVNGFVLQAHASACNTPKSVQIRFTRGSTCWTYSGTAEVFTGKFKAGQSIQVSAVGPEQEMGANGKIVTHTSQRDVEVQLLGSSQQIDMQNGQMVTPATGTYTFTLYPCAIWGAPQKVQICTTPE